MKKLRNKIINYLKSNENKIILIDSENEIKTDEIIELAIKINKKKITNKKIVLNLERSADYIGFIFALWINGNTVIPTNKTWPKNI